MPSSCKPAGEGLDRRSDITFVTVSVEDDVVQRNTHELHGFKATSSPVYLKGSGIMLKELASRAGIDMDYCVALTDGGIKPEVVNSRLHMKISL